MRLQEFSDRLKILTGLLLVSKIATGIEMNTKAIKDFIRSGGYAWPGGYPVVLLMSDGEILCADCARENFRLILKDTKHGTPRDCWHAQLPCIHYEGGPLYCAHCNKAIESAYGGDDE